MTWKDKIPNTELLRHYDTSQAWNPSSGHLSFVGPVMWHVWETIVSISLSYLDSWKKVVCPGLVSATRYKDVLKATLKACGIDRATWKAEAVDLSRWRKICHDGTALFERNRTAHLIARREARYSGATNSPPTPLSSTQYYACPDCSKFGASHRGLVSRRWHKHRQ